MSGRGLQDVRFVGRWALVRVRGRSMAPTLREGDLLLVRRGTTQPGQLAVVRLPGDRPLSVKRVVAREGNDWWVERDNPNEGVDSWSVGAVPDVDIVAHVLCRVWPLRRSPGSL